MTLGAEEIKCENPKWRNGGNGALETHPANVEVGKSRGIACSVTRCNVTDLRNSAKSFWDLLLEWFLEIVGFFAGLFIIDLGEYLACVWISKAEISVADLSNACLLVVIADVAVVVAYFATRSSHNKKVALEVTLGILTWRAFIAGLTAGAVISLIVVVFFFYLSHAFYQSL
jgi:hypothetical protein